MLHKKIMSPFVVVALVTLGPWAFSFGKCPEINNSEMIQDQFALTQISTSQWTPLQRNQIAKVMSLNPQPIVVFNCYLRLIQKDTSSLAPFLTALKLSFLDIRNSEKNGNSVAVQERVEQLIQGQNILFKSIEPYQRRLAATIRALILDEMERLPESWRAQYISRLETLQLVPNIRAMMLGKMQQRLQALQKELGTKSTQELASYFGHKSYVLKDSQKPGLTEFILKTKKVDYKTLAGQLTHLFMDQQNVNWAEVQSWVQHYQSYVATELEKNPYQSVGYFLKPLLQTEWTRMTQQFGMAMPLLAGISNLTPEGQFSLKAQDIQLLTPGELDLAKSQYKKIKNPLGQMARYTLLLELVSTWTELDIAQMQTDLNRVALYRAAEDLRHYSQAHRRLPSSIEQIYTGKDKNLVPRDYFSGKPLRYSAEYRRFWFIGENGKDENGSGDDLSLQVNF